MKSIILNMRGNIDGYKAYNLCNPKYLNLLNSFATVSPLTRNPRTGTTLVTPCTVVPGYPIANLTFGYRTTRECRIANNTTDGAGFSGIEISLQTTGLIEQSTFNTIFVNVNKLNKTYINKFYSTRADSWFPKFTYNISFRKRSTPDTVVAKFQFYNENNSTNDGMRFTQSGTTYTLNYIGANLKEGNILLDSKMLAMVDNTNPDGLVTADWFIDVWISNQNMPVAVADFSVSNIFIGNAVDLVISMGTESTKDNLNVVTTGIRTGTNFVQINESLKSFKMNFDILTAVEANENVYNFISVNKDTPLAFFPFVDYDEDDIEQNKENLEKGGLFMISKDLSIKNTKWDVYSFSLELKEYK